jgi:hypothetical protein
MEIIEGDNITGVSEAINVAFDRKDCFYRGETDSFSLPIPKIFRDRYWPNNDSKYSPENTEKLRAIETHHIYEFKRLAIGLASDLPEEENPINNLKWLFLMQHHGMPRRLLDWTQNILVALFFAVVETTKDNDEKDSQIWIIQPQELNEEGGVGHTFPLPGHPIVEYLAREMFYGIEKKEGFAKKLSLREIQTKPVAILPPLAWPRMIAQKSAFTLHPKPRSFEDIYAPNAKLTRHKIPLRFKLEICRELRLIGIEYRTLFPELDSISKDMNSQFDDELM